MKLPPSRWSFRDSITTPRGTFASLLSSRHGFQLSKVAFEETDEGEEREAWRQELVLALLESVQYTEDMHLKISSESLLGFTMLSTIWEEPRRSPRVVWLPETDLAFSYKMLRTSQCWLNKLLKNKARENAMVLLTLADKDFKLAWKLRGHEEERSDAGEAWQW